MTNLLLQVEGSPPGQPKTSLFKYLWAKHVSGFKPEHHCANCLAGPFERIIHRGMTDGQYQIPIKSPFFYICGVTAGWKNNLHFAVAPRDGGVAMIDAEFGIRFIMYNAVRVPIAPLPLGWQGLPKTYTACRNFQFGVEQFGYKASPVKPATQPLF